MFASTNLKNVKYYPERLPIDAQVKDVFKRFDRNGDGFLSVKELRDAYSVLGMSFPLCRAWRALSIADEDHDGYISEEEFLKLVKRANK